MIQTTGAEVYLRQHALIDLHYNSHILGLLHEQTISFRIYVIPRAEKS